MSVCPDCEPEVERDESGRAECRRCETLASPTSSVLDLQEAYRDALQNVGERETAFEQLKASSDSPPRRKSPEPIEKGSLREKRRLGVRGRHRPQRMPTCR